MSAFFTPKARTDLSRIHSYIAKDNPAAASRLAVELLAACDRLELFPERGRKGRIAQTRELTTVWPYVIVYRIRRGNVEVLRIWHGRQERGRG
jgi:plasmid stabilization system protein ParE